MHCYVVNLSRTPLIISSLPFISLSSVIVHIFITLSSSVHFFCVFPHAVTQQVVQCVWHNFIQRIQAMFVVSCKNESCLCRCCFFFCEIFLFLNPCDSWSEKLYFCCVVWLIEFVLPAVMSFICLMHFVIIFKWSLINRTGLKMERKKSYSAYDRLHNYIWKWNRWLLSSVYRMTNHMECNVYSFSATTIRFCTHKKSVHLKSVDVIHFNYPIPTIH